MIKIENESIVGLEPAIRGMRNPMNSWDKSDSCECNVSLNGEDCPMVCGNDCKSPVLCNDGEFGYCVGENDYDLMKRLAYSGSDHAKYRRMIVIYADVTAPLYWWKEYDTYKVGTVANSCSTMHKIHAKDFDLSDFSIEHLSKCSIGCMNLTISYLNYWRNLYVNGGIHYDEDKRYDFEPRSKYCWWQMIELLPTAYNQRRTVMLNYEVLANMYHSRKNHKLDEWREFCEWIKSLPYSELITGEK